MCMGQAGDGAPSDSITSNKVAALLSPHFPAGLLLPFANHSASASGSATYTVALTRIQSNALAKHGKHPHQVSSPGPPGDEAAQVDIYTLRSVCGCASPQRALVRSCRCRMLSLRCRWTDKAFHPQTNSVGQPRWSCHLRPAPKRRVCVMKSGSTSSSNAPLAAAPQPTTCAMGTDAAWSEGTTAHLVHVPCNSLHAGPACVFPPCSDVRPDCTRAHPRI